MNHDRFDQGFQDANEWEARWAPAEPEADPAFDLEPEPEPTFGYRDDLEAEPSADELWPKTGEDCEEVPAVSALPAWQAPCKPLVSRQAGDPLPGKAKQKKDKVNFIKGPVCLHWVVRALALRKSAITVGLGLWLDAGLEMDDFLARRQAESKPIRVGRTFKERFKLTPSQSSRGIFALEAAGLIRIVKGGAGRCPEVTIVNLLPNREFRTSARKGARTGNRAMIEGQSHND